MEVLAIPAYLLCGAMLAAVLWVDSRFEEFMDHLYRQEEREAELLRRTRMEIEA